MPSLLLLLSQCKLKGCNIWLVPLPTNNLLLFIVVKPVPPLLTNNNPDVIFVAFNEVRPEPLPEIVPDTFKLPVLVKVNLLLKVPPSSFLKLRI